MDSAGLFKNISRERIENILKTLNARRISFKKDMTILSNLNNANEIGIIAKGAASLIRIDYNGNRSIVSTLTKDDLFGGVFSDYMNEEMSVIADAECEVVFVEYDQLLSSHIPEHEMIVENMIDILTKKINAYNRRIEILNKRTTRDKLLEYFHILEKEQATNRVRIPYTYTLLAEYIAVDRSAMMREIKYLKDENIIETNGKIVTIIYR